MKTCSKCGVAKPATPEFFYIRKDKKNNPLRADCKECSNKRTKKYADTHKSQIAEYGKSYYQKVKEKRNEYERNRRLNNPSYRIANSLRKRVWKSINFGHKSASTLDLLGCTIDHLKSHLESNFTEGMTWNNYGEWHIDHIRPCCSFDLTEPEQQRECFHYTNLQPLWAKDNLKKGGLYV